MENNPINGEAILIAEDNYFNYLLLSELMNRIRVQHFWAKNGEEAVDIFEKNDNIVLILMDINMPVMDGITATRKIRETNPIIPIIFQTAYDSEENKKECSDAGGSDFLTKPLTMSVLSCVLNKYLYKP